RVEPLETRVGKGRPAAGRHVVSDTMTLRLAVALALLALLASSALSRASAQATPDSVRRGPKVTLEYDTATDSTTRSLSAFAFVDTTAMPPDSIAVELLQ